MEPTSRVLASAVRARRIELEMTIEDAAARANLSTKAWRMIEQGTTQPSLLMLGSVCRALKWTAAMIESLVEGDVRVEEGEVVVDLDGSPPEDVESEPQTQVVLELDVEGLTRAQLAEVQNLIDKLRGTGPVDD